MQIAFDRLLMGGDVLGLGVPVNGMVYNVEVSDDLINWDNANHEMQLIAVEANQNGTSERVVLQSEPTSSQERMFMRMQIDLVDQ